MMWENTNVNYYPYVGSKYNEAAVKILVLGESHYYAPREGFDPNNYSALTIETVKGDYGCVGWKLKTNSFFEFPKESRFVVYSYINNYRKTANLISGVDIYTCDYVWEQLAFYNFFQRVMGSTPTNHSYFNKDPKGFISQARIALLDVLDRLKPDIVLIWGIDDLTNVWLEQDGKIKNVIPGTNCFKYKKYPHTIFLPMAHPRCNRLPYDEWKILKRHYPDIEKISQIHHPAISAVMTLKSNVSGKLRGFISAYSECTFSVCLYPFENGVCNSKSEKVMYVENRFDENLSSQICFRTAKYNPDLAKKMLKDKSWNINVAECKIDADGRVVLATLPSNVSDETRTNSFLDFAQRMRAFRDSEK